LIETTNWQAAEQIIEADQPGAGGLLPPFYCVSKWSIKEEPIVAL